MGVPVGLIIKLASLALKGVAVLVLGMACCRECIKRETHSKQDDGTDAEMAAPAM